MGRGSEELGDADEGLFVRSGPAAAAAQDRSSSITAAPSLTVEGSRCWRTCKKLEAQGVEILTCGTCLNFYGLTDRWRWAASPICTPLWRTWRMPGRSSSHDLPGQRRHHPAQAARGGRGGGRGHERLRQQRPGHPCRRPWRRPGASTACRQTLAPRFGWSRADRVCLHPQLHQALNIGASPAFWGRGTM